MEAQGARGRGLDEDGCARHGPARRGAVLSPVVGGEGLEPEGQPEEGRVGAVPGGGVPAV